MTNLTSASIITTNTPQAEKSLVEYFAGIGLVRLGLEIDGWKTLFANDISVRKYEMYSHAFPEDSAYFSIGNIFELDWRTIPHATLATCSFPCTDLSLAGKYEGLAGWHSSAFWGFIDILRSQGTVAPPLVILENVGGWLNSNDGQDFYLTIQALNRLGYVCDVFTLDALRFTPQSRPRVFVIGSRIHLAAESIDPLLSRNSGLVTSRLREAVKNNPDLRWMWLDIPEPPPLLHEGLSTFVENIADIDPRWWNEAEVERHLLMMSNAHYDYVRELSSSLWWSYRTIFRRMRKGQQRAEVRHDDVSWCLRTASGGSARQILLKAGQGRIQMRHMTAREYVRLQAVPDTYPIVVRELDALTGFGDAVCVPLITWIAQNILSQLIA